MPTRTKKLKEIIVNTFSLLNSHLQVEIAEQGAEVRSVKSLLDNTEYLWWADAAHWSRSAPILFPIVGKLKNDVYTLNEIPYNMRQHGFARDMKHSILNKSDDQISYILEATDETKKVYPFDFELYTHYKLIDKTLFITYEIVHVFGNPLPYAFGTHPAFLLGHGDTAPRVTSSESLPESISYLQNGLLADDTTNYEHEAKSLSIAQHTFNNDALIFKNYNPKSWNLLRSDGKQVTIETRDFPHSALWSKPGAPFVCIERWTGHADTVHSPENILEKESVLRLKNGRALYAISYTFN
ncbi:MAG: hypothetical protein RI911_257 [Candidatus Parcubacteria bacterium]|jgi:galactose mutarotase-like enzyme